MKMINDSNYSVYGTLTRPLERDTNCEAVETHIEHLWRANRE